MVSVGIDMSDFIKRYKEITGIECGIAIKDEVLKRSLLERSYRAYLRDKVRSGNLIIDQTGRLNPVLVGESSLSLPLTEMEDILLCSSPIRDISGRVIGYFFTYKNVHDMMASIALESLKGMVLVYIPSFFLLFAVWIWVTGSLSRRIENLLRITNLIRRKKFEGLDEEEIKDPRDEIDLVRNAIVETGIELKKFIEVLSKEVEVFSGKAYTDALTGVFNRRALEEFGARLIERTLSIGKPVSLLMIDIDNFKEVNDTYGHKIGDEVLKQVAETMRGTLRDSDLVFRYGGEEFLVVLPGANLEGALKAAENVRKRIEVKNFRVGDLELSLTVSIGVAQVREDVDEAIQKADRAMYIAKKTGKNRVATEE